MKNKEWLIIIGLVLLFGILIAIGCQRTEKILIATPDKPEFAYEPTDPPKGWRIEYNDVTEEYRWCFPSGYCLSHTYNTRAAAVKRAWEQYSFGLKNDEGNWKRVK